MKVTKYEREYLLRSRKQRKVYLRSKKITSFRKSSKPSSGEKAICDFLVREQIYFIREYYFTGCYSRVTKHLLYFDFWLPEYNLVIEYDGEQHYSMKKTDNEKANDFIKNAFCYKNNIDLLRIKYSQFSEIEQIICKKIDQICPI